MHKISRTEKFPTNHLTTKKLRQITNKVSPITPIWYRENITIRTPLALVKALKAAYHFLHKIKIVILEK